MILNSIVIRITTSFVCHRDKDRGSLALVHVIQKWVGEGASSNIIVCSK